MFCERTCTESQKQNHMSVCGMVLRLTSGVINITGSSLDDSAQDIIIPAIVAIVNIASISP